MTDPIFLKNVFTAVLLQLYLSTFGHGLLVYLSMITRYEMIPIMDVSVLFTSTSVNEFWSSKWNILIHQALKNGVYKPVLLKLTSSNHNKVIASICTFIASGLFHDWLLQFMSITLIPDGSNTANPMKPTYGPGICFFLWQAILVGIEFTIRRIVTKSQSSNSSSLLLSRLHRFWQCSIPNYVKTFVVVCLGIPIAHWFLQPYIECDFFTHGQNAIPMIVTVVGHSS